ncbi:hypothetical protein ABK040_008851 [Willaertia magna]
MEKSTNPTENQQQTINPEGNVNKSIENSEEKLSFKELFSNKIKTLPSFPVYFLVILFGLSSWIAVNGLYSEIPIFVEIMPEKYNIAVDMNLSLQLANIIPFLYFIFMIFQRIYKRNKITFLDKIDNRFNLIDTIFILCLFFIGIVTLILMSFLWKISINGRSIPFLILMFFIGVCDCSSTLLYYPFILHFKHAYSSALLIGESLTGLVGSILVLIQQPAKPEPLYPFWVLCVILAIITLISGVAFCLLRFLPYCKKQLRQQIETLQDEKKKRLFFSSQPFITWSTFRLMAFQFFISVAENGVVVSIIPHVFSNYKNHAVLLQYAVTLSMIASPIASLVAYVFPYFPFPIALTSHLLWIVGSCFLTFIAFMNPNPPLKYSNSFGIGLVVISIVTKFFLTFCKTKEFLVSHQIVEKKESKFFAKVTASSESTENLEAIVATTTTNNNNFSVNNSVEEGNNNDNQSNNRIARIKEILDLNPFRMAGFSIQLGSLLSTILIKILIEAKALK